MIFPLPRSSRTPDIGEHRPPVSEDRPVPLLFGGIDCRLPQGLRSGQYFRLTDLPRRVDGQEQMQYAGDFFSRFGNHGLP